MKKLLRALAVVLALTLVIGVVPVSAASKTVTLSKTKKTLYLGGCTGAKESGKKAKYYSYTTVKKLLNNYDATTMKIRLTSSDTNVCTVSNSTTKVKAKGIGSAVVTVKVYNGKVKSANLIYTGELKITVNKNATNDTFKISGLEDFDSFTVGDSVEVSLPRSGVDTDARRLYCKIDGVEIKSAGTRKWTLTFKQAGSYEIHAEAYQSSTYAKATASKVLTIDVEDAGSVEQVTAKSFALTGDFVDSNLKASEIKFGYNITVSDKAIFTPVSINSKIIIKDGVATVSAYGNFVAGREYIVKVAGQEFSFTAVGTTAKDVTSMEIVTEKVKAGAFTELEYKFYSNGVDITSEVGSSLKSSIKLTKIQGDDKAIVSGSKVYLMNDGMSLVVHAECTTGYEGSTPIKVEADQAIYSYEEPKPVVTEIIYSLNADDGIYMSKTDKTNHTICVGDKLVLEALFVFSDGTVKTIKDMKLEYPEFNFLHTNPLALTFGTYNSSFGLPCGTIGVGTDTIVFFEDAKQTKAICDAIYVDVQAKRVPNTINAVVSKSQLNANAAIGDDLTVTAVIRDQYGDVMTGEAITITQDEGTIASTGKINFGSFAGNILYVSAGQVGTLTGKSTGIIATVASKTDPKVNTVISFDVKDVPAVSSEQKNYKAAFAVEGDKFIDTTLEVGAQLFDVTDISLVTSKDGYLISEGWAKMLSKVPDYLMTNTELGCAEGDYVYRITLTYNDGTGEKFITTNQSGVSIDSHYGVEFTPVSLGKKLAAGTYTFTLYGIEAGKEVSWFSILDSVIINVTDDSDGALTYVPVNDNITVPTGSPVKTILTSLFEFYYNGVKVNASDINVAVWDTVKDSSTGYTIITSITLTFNNSVYGTFSAKLTNVNVPANIIYK